MIDAQGKELKLGDKVAYATAGSYDKKPALGVGFICEIDDEKSRFRVWRGLTQNKSGWINAGNYKGIKVAKIG